MILIATVAGYETGTILGGSVERRLAAAVAAADLDDPNWRLDDLLENREPVPDDENSSHVMDQVLAFLPKGWLATTNAGSEEERRRLEQIKEAFDALQSTALNVRLSNKVADSLRAEMATLEEAVALARSLRGYRRGQHELEIGPTIQDTPLQQTQDARSVARLLVIDSAMRAHAGDMDGALDSCEAILGAGRSIGDEPFLISALVRIAIGSVALQSVRRVLGQGEPTDAALGRLQATVADELAQPLLVVPLRGHRGAYVELIRRVGYGELPITALSGTDKPGQAIPNPAESPWTKLWFDYQIVVHLEWMNEAIAIAKRPAAEHNACWIAWQARADRIMQTSVEKFTVVLPILLSPAVPATGTAFLRYQSELGATVILIAAERHRRKTGKWLSAIAEVDRSILSDAPVDPYSGQPFQMEHRDGQLFVYSIGPNSQDEHGDFNPKLWPKLGHDDVGAHAWDVSLRGRKP